MTDIDRDDVEDIKSQPQQTFPDHWSIFLHCTICFGFFHNPHTLECGHSFCKRCLKRLAEISRDDNPDIRLRRLCVSCPACRHPFRAKPAIRGRVRTCIVLKQLVDLWKQECKILLSSSPRQLRSICSQTDGDKVGDVDVKENTDVPESTAVPIPSLQEEFSVRLPPGDEYFEAVMRQVSEASSEIDQDLPDEKIGFSSFLHAAGQLDTERSREIHSSSDTESSVSSSGDELGTAANRGLIAVGGGRAGGGHGGGAVGGVDGNNADAIAVHQTGSNRSNSDVSIPEFFGHMSVSVSMFRTCEWFPIRCLLMIVWFVYSLLIVALAEAFLPYVMIFTLFFFLIVLK